MKSLILKSLISFSLMPCVIAQVNDVGNMSIRPKLGMPFGTVVVIEGVVKKNSEDKPEYNYIEVSKVGEKSVTPPIRLRARGVDRFAGRLIESKTSGTPVRLVVYERVVCLGIPKSAYKYMKDRVPKTTDFIIDTSLTVVSESSGKDQ